MRVRVRAHKFPMSCAQDTWFHEREGQIFDVLAVFESNQRLYKVDVRRLFVAGQVDAQDAFLPSDFAELVDEPAHADGSVARAAPP